MHPKAKDHIISILSFFKPVQHRSARQTITPTHQFNIGLSGVLSRLPLVRRAGSRPCWRHPENLGAEVCARRRPGGTGRCGQVGPDGEDVQQDEGVGEHV